MSDQGDSHFTYYIVCVIDVLGQGERLAGWSKLPPSGQLPSGFLDSLKKTVGVVRKFRQWFEEYYKTTAACSMPEQYARLSADQKAQYNRLKTVDLKTQQFADTFVFYTPTLTPQGDFAVMGLYRILGACCMAMISSLAGKEPMRGAVCIGTGTELDEGTFYGPALAEAHHMECEVAGYPRIVVSDRIPPLLDRHERYSGDPEINKVLQVMADTSASLICTDFDGLSVIDFLGKGSRDLHGDRAAEHVDLWKTMISSIWNFARSEAQRFEGEGNAKLAQRYKQLAEYMRPRLALWGVEAEGGDDTPTEGGLR